MSPSSRVSPHRYNERFYSPTCTADSHMKVILVPVTPFQQNCSIVICEASKRAAIVDPGGDIDRIIAEVDRHGVTVEKFF